jgi:hypothetical protein
VLLEFAGAPPPFVAQTRFSFREKFSGSRGSLFSSPNVFLHVEIWGRALALRNPLFTAGKESPLPYDILSAKWHGRIHPNKIMVWQTCSLRKKALGPQKGVPEQNHEPVRVEITCRGSIADLLFGQTGALTLFYRARVVQPTGPSRDIVELFCSVDLEGSWALRRTGSQQRV